MNLRLPKARNISNPAFDPHKGSPTQTSDSVCGGERRSSGTRELLPQVEAKDVELAHAVIYKLFTQKTQFRKIYGVS